MTEIVWDEEEKAFKFKTEFMEGTLVPEGKLHGVHRLVHKRDMHDWRGTYPGELPAYGIHRGDKLFLLNIYHLLARGLHAGRLTGRLLEQEYTAIEGGVELLLKPSEICPVTHRVRYEIKEPSIIDLRISITSHGCMEAYEVWVSSYLSPKATPYLYMYNNPARRDLRGERFVPILENEFIRTWWGGGYLFFPRDNRSASLVYDGRWGERYQPFIVGPYYARPLMVNLNEESGVALVQMARPETCDAVYASWIRVTSTERANTAEYFVFFGEDLKPGDVKEARMRTYLIEMGEDFDVPLRLYDEFIEETGGS